MESILLSIKKLLGLEGDYSHFDPDIIIGINTALSSLNQLGVGPEEGFIITDDTATWRDLFGEAKNLEMVKSYVHLKTKLLFDPPTAGPMVEAINRQLAELEWRISITKPTEVRDGSK